jgi:nicotinamidase-related amidase
MDKNTALLVIDVQQCNFEESPPVHKGGELLSKIGALIAQARAVGVPIIYVQHCGRDGAIDEPDTSGWEIHAAVAPIKGDLVIEKRHPDAFQDTSLLTELVFRGIKKLIIAGIQTEYCVDTTCRRAYSLGYKVMLVEDAHSTWTSRHLTAPQIIEHHNAVLGGWFVELKRAGEIEFSEAAYETDCCSNRSRQESSDVQHI